ENHSRDCLKVSTRLHSVLQSRISLKFVPRGDSAFWGAKASDSIAISARIRQSAPPAVRTLPGFLSTFRKKGEIERNLPKNIERHTQQKTQRHVVSSPFEPGPKYRCRDGRQRCRRNEERHKGAPKGQSDQRGERMSDRQHRQKRERRNNQIECKRQQID